MWGARPPIALKRRRQYPREPQGIRGFGCGPGGVAVQPDASWSQHRWRRALVDAVGNFFGPPALRFGSYVRLARLGWFYDRPVNVRLIGCNNPAGHLQLSAGPICDAKSFLGAGQATCIATSDGSDLKVVVHFVYPFGLNVLAGPNTTTTFWIDHSGSYRS